MFTAPTSKLTLGQQFWLEASKPSYNSISVALAFGSVIESSFPTCTIALGSSEPHVIIPYVGQSGEYAVAGYGVGTRIEQVVLLPILGINTAIISIIAQNYGANNLVRIKETYFTAIKYAFIIMITAGTLVFLSASVITSFFSSDPEVIEYGKRYLKISAFVLPAYPVFFLSNGFFMALKKSENAMISNFFRNVLNPIQIDRLIF